MFNLMTKLFPIHRSITGNGVRETLKIIQDIIPITIHEIESGTKVFDWEIPEEWNIRSASVKDCNGNTIVDIAENNLHVVSYSVPFDGTVSLEELSKHIYTLPENPEWIPYITSYYNRTWGFCMRHKDFTALKDVEYSVNIDSDLKKGSLTYADLVIPGKSRKEILFTTNICHPSMANNELSGPVVMTYLAKKLLEMDLEYTYRFVFVPETIGAITYIHENLDILKSNVIAGYTVVCVGDSGKFSYLKSRTEDSIVNRVTQHILRHTVGPNNYNLYDFCMRGSDERQYNYPGIDIEIGSLMKTLYAFYPEYHTSADDLTFVSPHSLKESLDMYLRCIKAFEHNHTYANTTLCEPQLGKRNMYPLISTKESIKFVRNTKNVLALSDGKTDLISIADRMGVCILDIIDVTNQLVENELLVRVS